MRGRYRDFSCAPFLTHAGLHPHYQRNPPGCFLLVGLFAKGEPVLTPYSDLKSVVYLKVDSWCCRSYEAT